MKNDKAVARTTPDLIADALRDEIVDGLLQPGQALRQDELARRFAVSRIPVREALKRLEEEGLVTVHANRGTFVTKLSDEDVIEAFDLRALLESDLARRSVPRMSPKDLLMLERATIHAEQSVQTVNWNKLDNEFHRVLYEPAGRPRQLAMVMALRILVQRSSLVSALPTWIQTWIEGHRRMLEACRNGDADTVAQLIETDMRRDADDVRAHLAAQANQLETGLLVYDEVRWRRAMLDLRPNCECCDRDLPNGDPDARICSFENTFCASCADDLFSGICPSCDGDLVRRPTRPEAHLADAPPSDQRVVRFHSELQRKKASSKQNGRPVRN